MPLRTIGVGLLFYGSSSHHFVLIRPTKKGDCTDAKSQIRSRQPVSGLLLFPEIERLRRAILILDNESDLGWNV